MAIALVTSTVRHERRVRLIFDLALAAGAFASTSFYTVEAQDDTGAAPGVAAALVVPASPNVVELQMDADLSQGTRYRFYAEAVPGIDASTTALGSFAEAVIPVEPTASALVSAPGQPDIIEEILYGRDVRIDDDVAEGPSGDLGVVSGIECVTRDLTAALVSDGLPWDPAFGAHPRPFTDAPSQTVTTFADQARAAMLRDDRVTAATATVDVTAPDAPRVAVEAQLLRREPLKINTAVG